jgi:hypothetical protein
MKAHTLKLAAAAMLAAVSFFFTSCFYMPGVAGGKARAGLILPRALIANPVSLALVVGGPGMNPMFASYSPIPASISIDVPSGLARTFTVLLNGQSATLQGQATADLQPGETKDITVTPTIAGTQIVIPDNGNSSVVQIADMSGTLSTALTASFPTEVDFDDQGKMYVATSSGISQMDDITGTNSVPLTLTATGIQSIAIDRARGMLYYVGYDTNFAYDLWSMQVSPKPGAETPVIVGIAYSRGIAVDSDGFVYVATSSPSVLKIDPRAQKVVLTYSGSLVNPWDVLVNGNYVYVSDYGAKQIIRLSKNLDFVDSISGHGSDSFLGPERFVAVLNKPITVIDEANFAQGNRLVSFGDMTGAGWTTYEPEISPGVDAFQFFTNNNGG